MIKLPTEPQKPTADISKVTMLIYGQPKIGKSTFCSRFENHLFIATEPGLNFLETTNVRCSTWADALDIIEALEKQPHNFKTIIIDTVDRLWEACTDSILRKYKINTLADMGYGKGYELAQNEFRSAIRRLEALGLGLVFVSHSTLNEIDTLIGKQKQFCPTIPPRARAVLEPFVDIIGFCTLETAVGKDGQPVENRIMSFETSNYFEAGDRTGRLKGRIPLKYLVFKRLYETIPGEKQPATPSN